MRKVGLILLVAVQLVLGFCGLCFGKELVWEEISKGESNLTAVLILQDNPRVIYVGSKRGVSKSEDAGMSWRNILSIRGRNSAVNLLAYGPKDQNILYAATANGLFCSSNQGRDWKRIFRGRSYLENDCTAVLVTSSAAYLGTKAGLFVSRDKGRNWDKERGALGNSCIFALTYNNREPGSIYAATAQGVFRYSVSGRPQERIFVVSPAEERDDTGEVPEENAQDIETFEIRYITFDSKLNLLYLATARGVYKSEDNGKDWERLTDFGLLSKEVNFLMVSRQSTLYAVSKSGIFEFRGQRWQELSLGLSAERVRFFTEDSQGNLYAACERGLFRAKLEPTESIGQDFIAPYIQDEPGIKAVQAAAIKYADVDSEKIERWKRQAAKRVFFPRLSIGMDRDQDKTVANSVWGTSGTNGSPGKYFVGPDDETRYDNRNYSVSLTWELGDLIWSDDQTSIDVRSRLLVQLREDILDEVTKLYFERLRVKMELDELSIEDRRRRREKELRLQELTASLDALTGGYFTQQIQARPKL
jgi:hypothetical protein